MIFVFPFKFMASIKQWAMGGIWLSVTHIGVLPDEGTELPSG